MITPVEGTFKRSSDVLLRSAAVRHICFLDHLFVYPNLNLILPPLGCSCPCSHSLCLEDLESATRSASVRIMKRISFWNFTDCLKRSFFLFTERIFWWMDVLFLFILRVLATYCQSSSCFSPLGHSVHNCWYSTASDLPAYYFLVCVYSILLVHAAGAKLNWNLPFCLLVNRLFANLPFIHLSWNKSFLKLTM